MNAKQKGNRYERAVAELLRIYGWAARTSRETSKVLDDAGVDIDTDAPFNIQCKHTERAPAYHKLLSEMPLDKPPVVFHKRNNKGSVVVMRLQDFCNLLLQRDDIIKEHPIFDKNDN